MYQQLDSQDQFNGFGAEMYTGQGDNITGNQVTLNELQKAMGTVGAGSGAGYDAPDPGAGSIQPTITESLESTLKRLTLSRRELRVWRQFKTSPAYALSEEFLQLTDIGSETGGFHNEFDLPEQEDSTYKRKAERVKYMGVTKAISHQATLVDSRLGDVINTEVENGTTWMLRRLNRSLIFGNERVVNEEWNGIYEQHGKVGSDADSIWSSVDDYYNSELVIDKRGSHINQEDFIDAAEIIDNNHGLPDTLYGPNNVIADLAKDYIDKQRLLLNSGIGGAEGQGQHLGSSFVKTIPTPFGDIALERDKYLKQQTRAGRRPYRTTDEGSTSTKAPATPTANSISVANNDGSSVFQSGDTGDYYYAVAAVNRFGESALKPANGDTKVTISAANDAVDFDFSETSGTYETTGFVVYRSEIDPTSNTISGVKLYPIFEISKSELQAGYDGGSQGVARDRNRYLPNTDQAFMWETGDTVSAFKQLAPLMRMDLARLDPTIRFMILLYGTPQLYNHLRVVRFVNVGRYD